MIRKIITPKTNTITLELPESYIGKTIEILAFSIVLEVEKDTSFRKTNKLDRFYKSLDMFTDDFMIDRVQPSLQEREGFV